MNQRNNDDSKSRRSTFLYVITIIRGLILLVLGFSLLVTEQTRPILFNAIGLFWIVTGIAGIRYAEHPAKPTVWRAFAFVGLIAGILVIIRGIIGYEVEAVWFVGFLGVVILLNGLLHLATRYLHGKQSLYGRRLLNTLLGVLELLLGTTIILRILSGNPLFLNVLVVVATIWALLGGFMLLVSVLLQKKRSPQKEGN